MHTHILRIASMLPVLGATLLLAACDTTICLGSFCFGGSGPPPPQDTPGSYSYYSQEAFTNPNLSSFCLSSYDMNCVFIVNANFGQPLSGAGWSINNGNTDGFINGAWTVTETTASQVIADTANVVYIDSHGGVFGGLATICLRDCNGSQVGGTVGVGTGDIPSRWSGPTWLIVDACDVVQPGVGWESVFGGHLHGILGYNAQVDGLNLSGYAALTKYIIGYDTAMDAWEQAVAAGSDFSHIAMLVPNANTYDRIEARGGPHFGYDGDTNPVYYYCCNTQGGVTPGSVARLGSPTSTVYSLTPEQMNESYWYNLYGGANVPHSYTTPSSNEHLYRNPYVLVNHYLASGGLLVASSATGTARGLSESAAYQFALSWIQSNGGLPSDAVLTFTGDETVAPTQLPVVVGGAYPNVRQYAFIWRHGSSGILSGDKIQVNVDDEGTWRIACDKSPDPPFRRTCHRTNEWLAKGHITTYVRVWRSIGSTTSSIIRHAYTLPQQIVPSQASGNALCASDMTLASSVATPCDVYVDSVTKRAGFVDPSTGALLSVTERL